MLDEGPLSNLPIEEIYALHNLPGEPVGQLSTRHGLICSSESLFEIIIEGQKLSCIYATDGKRCNFDWIRNSPIYSIYISRKIHSNSGIVISVTEFITNGNRNILAGKVTLKGDARAQSKEERIAIEKFIRQISKGIAITHDVSIEVKFQTEFIETLNSKRPTDAVIKIGEKIGLNGIPNRKPMSFSEDFAHFSNCFPGCFFLLGKW